MCKPIHMTEETQHYKCCNVKSKRKHPNRWLNTMSINRMEKHQLEKIYRIIRKLLQVNKNNFYL